VVTSTITGTCRWAQEGRRRAHLAGRRHEDHLATSILESTPILVSSLTFVTTLLPTRMRQEPALGRGGLQELTGAVRRPSGQPELVFGRRDARPACVGGQT
jgi:hypothetical protein